MYRRLILTSLIFNLVLISNRLASQVYFLDSEVKFDNPTTETDRWTDTSEVNVKYWENGMMKLEYQKDNPTVKIEYYESGNVKYKAEIVQIYSVDTIEIYDYDKDNYEVQIIKGFKDILNGNFISYSDKEDKAVESMGVYNLDQKEGEWNYYGEDSYLVVNYNADGFIEGKCSEYYLSESNDNTLLRCKGKYKKRMVNEEVYNFDLDKYVLAKRNIIKKAGVWAYYDKDGELIEKKRF